MTSRWPSPAVPLVAFVALVALAACGGSQPSPAAGAPVAPSAEPAAPAADTATAAPEAATDEQPAAAAAPPPADDKPARKGRDVIYRMTPSGLIIEVEGVRLEPKAEPVKTGRGWGVKLRMKATATDGHLHRFLAPEGGALMVASEIVHANGKKDRVADERKGDGEELVPPGDSTDVVRTVAATIRAGESLTLEVGLWGLGMDDGERRPVKKLFVLKMVAGAHKPAPVITPPE